jgi:hypothetical protein
MKTRREFAAALIAAMVGTACAPAQQEPAPGIQPDPRGELPLLALWISSHGNGSKLGEPPELRFAIWEDGRVLCAKDPEKGGMPLRAGTITGFLSRAGCAGALPAGKCRWQAAAPLLG